jgi:hypothetical protein
MVLARLRAAAGPGVAEDSAAPLGGGSTLAAYEVDLGAYEVVYLLFVVGLFTYLRGGLRTE